MGAIRVKRVYEAAGPRDGYRVLVDRIWPRGISREKARIDVWFKSVAPSTELRKWFAHDPLRWDGFRKRYFAELKKHPEGLEELLLRAGRLTLVYSARDLKHNQAVALKQYLDSARGG